jgi:hypothetical protein
MHRPFLIELWMTKGPLAQKTVHGAQFSVIRMIRYPSAEDEEAGMTDSD